MHSHKIQCVSKNFKYLFMGIAALWIPLHLIIYFGYGGNTNLNGFTLALFKDQQLLDFAKLGFGQRFLAVFVRSLVDIFPLYIVYSLIKLFGLYEKGQYFLVDNIKHLKHIGLAMLTALIIDPFHQLLMTASLSIMANPPGQREMAITIGNAEIYWILMAFMIYLVAWIMDEGRKLHDEVEQTI